MSNRLKKKDNGHGGGFAVRQVVTEAPPCGRRILSSVLRRKKRKPSPKKEVKEAAGVPSAKRGLATWRV